MRYLKMFFTSQLFVFALLPLTLLVYYAAGKKLRPAALAVMSTLIYFLCSPGGAVILLSVTFLMMPLLKAMAGNKDGENSATRPLAVTALVAAILLNAGVLVIFGYAEMTAGFLNTFLSLIWTGLSDTFTFSQLIAPIGLSFYTLRNIAYAVSVFKGDTEPEKDALVYYNFMTFFPAVICGPVTSFNDIRPSLVNPSVSVANLAEGLCRFVFGLAKVVLIAGNLAPIADKAALLPEIRLTFGLAWVGVFCKLFAVYFTLAGGFDMAIGIAHALGITLPESMHNPFSASSVTDFFKRYNSTVTAFYNDNILTLKGMTAENLTHRSQENFMRNVGVFANWMLYAAAILLCGLWYGAEWKYLLLAVMFGVLITVENLPSVSKVRAWKYTADDIKSQDPKRRFGLPALYFIKQLFMHIYPLAAFIVAVTAVNVRSFNQFRYYILALVGNGYISTVTGTFEYFGAEAMTAYIIAFLIITPWIFKGINRLVKEIESKTGFDANSVLIPSLRGATAILLAVLCAISI